MKASRLALPLAALAAVFGVSIAAAEDNPVREFLIQEARLEQPEANAPTGIQVASAAGHEQPPLAAANPTLAPAITAPSAANNTAPSAANNNVTALIDRYAAANGIPAAFARAVVRIESNFNPRATGSKGEVGLMQIKHQTARGVGFTGTREQLYDPATNLQWGMKYLAMSWKLGGNTPCGAVLRYQAGHAATRPTAASNAYCSKVRAHMASN
jgi:soluble lytic murein transglycosylase-like protein